MSFVTCCSLSCRFDHDGAEDFSLDRPEIAMLDCWNCAYFAIHYFNCFVPLTDAVLSAWWSIANSPNTPDFIVLTNRLSFETCTLPSEIANLLNIEKNHVFEIIFYFQKANKCSNSTFWVCIKFQLRLYWFYRYFTKIAKFHKIRIAKHSQDSVIRIPGLRI